VGTHGEDGEGGVRRGRGGGSRGGGARAVRPQQEEVLALFGLRGAPVTQQRALPPRLLLRRLPTHAGASGVLVARADPAPAAGAALGAGLLLDERGERHEPAPSALAPVVVVWVLVRRRRRRRRRRHSPAPRPVPDRIEAGGGWGDGRQTEGHERE
jgi:hypothetical protein